MWELRRFKGGLVGWDTNGCCDVAVLQQGGDDGCIAAS